MNIAIDITPLSTAHSRRGVGVYTKNLVDALQKYEKQHSYSLFTRKQKVPDNAGLVHYPYFDPFFLTLPVAKPKPTIVTVHDLIPLVFPDKFPRGLRGMVKWQIQKYSLDGAKRIITDSKCSKNDIAKITGRDRNSIDVVYLAPDSVFTPAANMKYPSAKPYVLYVGDVNWNKNVPGLLQAFSSLPGYTLVLVGSSFVDATLAETQQLNRLVHALGIEHSIRRVGQIPSGELAHLYRGAICLVQPSFYEGFGLPVLEAMKCGCPVVVSDTSSLHEIAGPSIIVSPDPRAIAQGLTRARNLTLLQRKKLISDQTRWVTNFHWKKVASETVAAYEKTLNNYSGV